MEKIIFDEIVSPIVKLLKDHITRHLGYVICSTKHVTDMIKRKEDLKSKRDVVIEHKNRNNQHNEEIPAGVDGWLIEVEKMKVDVESISSDGYGCLNIKLRYREGKKACKDTEKIEELLKTNSEFEWTNTPLPTGIVHSKPASSSSSGGAGFKSRSTPFNDALKHLQDHHNKSQVIALCGMGGVGKTTMMEELKTVANDSNMFDIIVPVVFGTTYKMESIQNDIAIRIGGKGLQELTVPERAHNLCEQFKKILDKKKTILVILDDVWKEIKLEHIGLKSPLPNGVMLLLTSRDSHICKQIAVDARSVLHIVHVHVLEEAEAQNFFSQITKVSEKDYPDLYPIGCKIVKKCGGLPLAIKIIGKALSYDKEKYVWDDTLLRLNNNDIDKNVQEVIKISYEYIEKDDKEVFLLCGLFPDDFDIPIEHLTRYAWGIGLFKGVPTLKDARDRTRRCVQNLINANLLLHSRKVDCVKMHDLLLAFVLGIVCEGERAWIINHGGVSEWGGHEKNCERISLTCRGMSEFPGDFKCPKLSLLQLMHGDGSLKFPYNFYENMENLKVIAYYEIRNPLLPRSLQCSTNLKTLCLYGCDLQLDYSLVGDLVNLEVLSFAYCDIYKIPSAIGNLVKLKLLDLTGCDDLHIDDGVFHKLVNLEELYVTLNLLMNMNWEELKMLSNKLFALEIEFNKKTELENFSFEKLVKFKIAIGCNFYKREFENDKYSFTNILKLQTDRKELVDCKINKLFNKTEKLYLELKEATCLEDVLAKPYDQHSFCNLRDLEVRQCNELKFLFTISVASGLKKLERLEISSCSVLEALIESEISSVGEIIKFENLKYLSLKNLPKLGCLFNVENEVELLRLVKLQVEELPNFSSIYPDKDDICALLNSKVKCVNLEKLKIVYMKGLKQIWGCEMANNISMLREIEVERCDSLENLFPTNPMRLLNHLERLTIKRCETIEEIFNIDLDSLSDEVEKHSSSSLRSIKVWWSNKVKEVWRIKGGENSTPILIGGFKAVESIRIDRCKRFRTLFTPTNTNTKFDMSALVDIWIDNGDTETETENRLSSLIPSNAIGQMQKLQVLKVKFCSSLMEVFETQDIYNKSEKNSGSGNITEGITSTTAISRRENINVTRLSNLKKLVISNCEFLQHVFSFSTVESLKQIEELEIMDCNAIKVIMKKENGGQRKDVDFPCLKFIILKNLPKLEGFFLGMNDFQWPLLEHVMINSCSNMMVFTSGQSTTPKLKYMHTSLGKHSLECGLNFNLKTHQTNRLPSSESTSLERLPIWSFHNLIELHMERNDDCVVKCIIPSNELLQLEKLERMRVISCNGVEEVFEVEALTTQTVVQIPNLTRIELISLHSLKYIWKSNHHHHHVLDFPNLTTLYISGCSSLKHVFSSSMVGSLQQLQDLNIMHCSGMEVIVKEESECDAKVKEILTFPCLKSLKLNNLYSLTHIWKSSHHHHILEFPNLTTLYIDECRNLKHVFSSSMVGSLQQLQHLHISQCKYMEVIVMEEEESECDAKVKKIVTLPSLKSLKLDWLNRLKGFWLGKDDLSCPSLHTLKITECPKITCFTMGHVATPELNTIHTNFGRCLDINEDLNSFIITKQKRSVLELAGVRHCGKNLQSKAWVRF